MEISPGSMSLQMQPRVWEPNFAAPWKGGEIGRAREDRFLPRPLWGAETHLQITWGCARNLACPRLPSLAPPELKHLSSFSTSIRSTASSKERRFFSQIESDKGRLRVDHGFIGSSS